MSDEKTRKLDPLSFGQFAWMPETDPKVPAGIMTTMVPPFTSVPCMIAKKILYLVSRCKACIELRGNQIIWNDVEDQSEWDLLHRYSGIAHQSTPVCCITDQDVTLEVVVDKLISRLSDIHRSDDTPIPVLTPQQEAEINHFFAMLPHRLGNSMTFDLEINGHKTMYQTVQEELNGGYGLPLRKGLVCRPGESEPQCRWRLSQGDVLYEMDLRHYREKMSEPDLRFISDNLYEVVAAATRFFSAREL